ncbi:MAG: hypothetical protein ACM3YE_17195 [Bacteroidota bacterium]
MIQYWLGLTPEQIETLNDNEFYKKAAQAEYLKEIESEIVRDGVLKALECIKIE